MTQAATGTTSHTAPPAARLTLARRTCAIDGLSLSVVREDIRAATDWSFQEPHHTLVVHLDGRLRRMESVFSRGPSSRRLPQAGDIWAIPAGCRYAALAQGSEVGYAEFRLAATGRLDHGLVPRLGHRDAFLHRAARHAVELAMRDDDLAALALPTVLESVNAHLMEHYLGAGTPAATATTVPTFSERQCRQLVEFVHASLGQRLSVEALARIVNVSPARFTARFQASFGTSPWQFVVAERLRWAQTMLRTTRRSITAIAADAGFASASHFTTRFVRSVGTTPSRFRQHGD